MAPNLKRRHAAVAIAVVAAVAILAYLRDPPWLADVSSGFDGWQTDDDGTKFRWTSGHASFFVPSDAAYIEIPVRAVFQSPHDWNIALSIAIDDRPAARVALTNESWRNLRVLLPAPGSRRVRRIDIRVNRVDPDDRGVQVGEIRVFHSRAANGSR